MRKVAPQSEYNWTTWIKASVDHGGGSLLARLDHTSEGTSISPDSWADVVVYIASHRSSKNGTRERLLQTVLDHPLFPDLPEETGASILRALLRKHNFHCLPQLVKKGMRLDRGEAGKLEITRCLNEGVLPPVELLWPDICFDEGMGPKIRTVVIHPFFLCNPANALRMVQLERNEEMIEALNGTVGRSLNTSIAKTSAPNAKDLAMRTLATLAEHDWIQIDRVREYSREYHRQSPSPVDELLSEVEAMVMVKQAPPGTGIKKARRI